MPQLVNSVPTPPRPKGLSTGQVKVLSVLRDCDGGLSRDAIAEEAGCSAVYVGKAIGRADPEARAAFENTQDGGFRPSLLTLGYVQGRDVVVPEDGVNETIYLITQPGLEALAKVDPSSPSELAAD